MGFVQLPSLSNASRVPPGRFFLQLRLPQALPCFGFARLLFVFGSARCRLLSLRGPGGSSGLRGNKEPLGALGKPLGQNTALGDGGWGVRWVGPWGLYGSPGFVLFGLLQKLLVVLL